jgi:hypothetical protein
MSIPEEELRRQMMRDRLAGLSGTPTQQGPQGPAVSSRSDMGGRLTELGAQNLLPDEPALSARQQAALPVAFIGPEQGAALDNLSQTADQVRQQRLNRLAQSDNITGQTAASIANATQINNFAETLRQQRLAAAERRSALRTSARQRSLADLARNTLLGATSGPANTARRERELAAVLPQVQALNQISAGLSPIAVNQPQNFLETEAQRNARIADQQLGIAGLAQNQAALDERRRANLAREQLGLGELALGAQRLTLGSPQQQRLALEQQKEREGQFADVQQTINTLQQLQALSSNTGLIPDLFGRTLGRLGDSQTSTQQQLFEGLASDTLIDAVTRLEGLGQVSNIEFLAAGAGSPRFGDTPEAVRGKIQFIAQQLVPQLEASAQRFPGIEPYIAELRAIAEGQSPAEQGNLTVQQQIDQATAEGIEGAEIRNGVAGGINPRTGEWEPFDPNSR